MEGKIIVTRRAVDRERAMQSIMLGKLTQSKAAKELGLSRRRVNYLFKRYRKDGIRALVSKRVGKPNARRHTSVFKERIRKVISAEVYKDFGPTLMSETLLEKLGIKISKETLRKWMVEWSLWESRSLKLKPIHGYRERRASTGELVQIDGSHHAWFEDRGPKCCLIVFVDDANSKILCHFSPAETTFAYMECLKKYIKQYGIPAAFYHDRHGIFSVATSEKRNQGVDYTQFGSVLHELGIKSIRAYSPQAKGRVERANRTLQDRLIKAMRLEQISTIDEANAYLPKFTEKYNRRLDHELKEDVHRDASNWLGKRLHRLLTWKDQKVISKNLSFQYKGCLYQIKSKGGGHHLKGERIIVRTYLDGKVELDLRGRSLDYEIINRKPRLALSSDKTINQEVDRLLKIKVPNPNPHGPTPIQYH